MSDNDGDDDDFWDEDYSERHESVLAQTDEIEYFKNTMAWLEGNNPSVYQGFLSCTSPEKLSDLNSKIQAVANLPKK